MAPLASTVPSVFKVLSVQPTAYCPMPTTPQKLNIGALKRLAMCERSALSVKSMADRETSSAQPFITGGQESHSLSTNLSVGNVIPYFLKHITYSNKHDQDTVAGVCLMLMFKQ
jgi:hypothetical protein